LVVY
jgi:hypothetical protein